MTRLVRDPTPLGLRLRPAAGRPGRWVACTSWIYAISVLGLCGLMRGLGDRWWLATLPLYGPRWVWSLPLAALVPAALFRPRSLVPLLGAAALIVGPVMGFCIPWRAGLSAAGPGPAVRVLSCNVQGGCLDADALATFIEAVRPDVVALQEWSRDHEVRLDAGYAASSPELRFRVAFATPGTYHVWLRGHADTDQDDSAHVGLDGVPVATAARVALGRFGAWAWTHLAMDGSPATLSVPAAGVHEVNVWMREDGFRLDRLILTTRADFRPMGRGPGESTRGDGPAPADAFREERGLVVIEAEHHQDQIRREGRSWGLAVAPAGFAGAGAMVAGPHNGRHVFRGEGWHVRDARGLCLASRYPIRDVIPAADPGLSQGSMVRYELELPDGIVHVFNLHLETPRSGLEAVLEEGWRGGPELQANIALRRDESAVARRWVGRAQGPLLLAGDFNMPDDSAIFRRSWSGYRDAFATAGLGFGLTKFTRRFGARIDHVLCGPGWQVRRCWVGPDVGSDHRPLVAEFVRTGGPGRASR